MQTIDRARADRVQLRSHASLAAKRRRDHRWACGTILVMSEDHAQSTGAPVASRPQPFAEGEQWVGELNESGPAGHAAQAKLHDILLRAARHQVWRLRDQLASAGAGELEDLAQQAANDAMVAVLGKLDSFEGRSKFTTWAYKFAILHAGVTVRRQAWRHREVAMPTTFDPVDHAASPDGHAQASDLALAIQSAIHEDLTPHQRKIALALLVEEVPIDVLAERLDTNRNALYKTLHDARSRLRASLLASGYLDQVVQGSPS